MSTSSSPSSMLIPDDETLGKLWDDSTKAVSSAHGWLSVDLLVSG